MLTTPIRKKEDIDILKNYFLSSNKYRNYVLFVVGINTALRISDLLRLRWGDVYDFTMKHFYSHICIEEQKTGKLNYIILNTNCREALNLLKKQNCPMSALEYIFCSQNNPFRPISRNWAYHIIKKAASSTGIEGNISCHSLRKTFGYHGDTL